MPKWWRTSNKLSEMCRVLYKLVITHWLSPRSMDSYCLKKLLFLLFYMASSSNTRHVPSLSKIRRQTLDSFDVRPCLLHISCLLMPLIRSDAQRITGEIDDSSNMGWIYDEGVQRWPKHSSICRATRTLGRSRNLELDRTSWRKEATEMPVDSKAEIISPSSRMK